MIPHEDRPAVQDLLDHLTDDAPRGHGLTVVRDVSWKALTAMHWMLHRKPETPEHEPA